MSFEGDIHRLLRIDAPAVNRQACSLSRKSNFSLIQSQVAAHFVEQILAIGSIGDGEILPKSDRCGMNAQQPICHRMKRPAPDPPRQ